MQYVGDGGIGLFSYGGSGEVSCVFFFSSRRRHTRFDCDWSSDVCSSDLPHRLLHRRVLDAEVGDAGEEDIALEVEVPAVVIRLVMDRTELAPGLSARGQIGRASCRERV